MRRSALCVIMGVASSIACAKADRAPEAQTSASATPVPGVVAGGGDESSARALVMAFTKPGADTAKLTQALKPKSDDYRAVFTDDLAAKAEAAYAKLWDSPDAIIQPKPDQTEVKLFSASADDLKNGTGGASHFPGGYKSVAGSFKPGTTWYAFKFVAPGQDLGMAFDALAFVNGHWAFFPKPFRYLK